MILPLWQFEGKQRFPDLGEVIEEAETPYELWTHLWGEFVAAYDSGDATRAICRLTCVRSPSLITTA
jgi:hypothetical protein